MYSYCHRKINNHSCIFHHHLTVMGVRPVFEQVIEKANKGSLLFVENIYKGSWLFVIKSMNPWLEGLKGMKNSLNKKAGVCENYCQRIECLRNYSFWCAMTFVSPIPMNKWKIDRDRNYYLIVCKERLKWKLDESCMNFFFEAMRIKSC